MNDPIEQLLRETDQSVHPAHRTLDTSELATRVLQTERKRRTYRTGGAIVAVLLVVSPIIYSTIPPKPDIQVRVDPGVNARLEMESDHLQARIAAQEATVRTLLAIEKKSEHRARLDAIARMPTADDCTERAASAIVFQADRMLREPGSAGPARKAYDEVISFFPQTISAITARQRLAELKQEG